MNRIGTVAALAAVATFTGVSAVRAQLPGIPLGVAPSGTGINVAADYAQPDNDLGGGSAWGISGGIGLGRVGLQAAFGSLDPDASSSVTTYAGLAGLRVFGGGLNPLAIGVEVGAGSMKVAGQQITQIPIGATVAFNPPLFPIKPWGVVYYREGDSNITKETRVSVGANFNFLLGLGVHAAYDWGDSGATWGVGAHFNFHVPTM
jgi:hypothetical protein